MNTSTNQPLVSVGIPTYNRPQGLKRTLECITGQTYQHLEIIVSDNCSPDEETQKVVAEFMKSDPRIQYYRQEENKGPTFNFNFVLKKASGEFFMWAADDDEWDKEFIVVCLGNLKQKENIGMSFSRIACIDSFGQIIREFPNLPHLTGEANRETIQRYVKSPPFFGKANLLYSIYDLEVCKQAWKRCPLDDSWGADMCFVLAAISIKGVYIDSRVLFRKRFARESDRIEGSHEINVSKIAAVRLNHFWPFLKKHLSAVKGTPFYFLTLFTLLRFLPLSFKKYVLQKHLY